MRLFDPELPAHGWAGSDCEANPYREAVFETLTIGDVRCVTQFVGSSRWC
jgi:hypothetical protein